MAAFAFLETKRNHFLESWVIVSKADLSNTSKCSKSFFYLLPFPCRGSNFGGQQFCRFKIACLSGRKRNKYSIKRSSSAFRCTFIALLFVALQFMRQHAPTSAKRIFADQREESSFFFATTIKALGRLLLQRAPLC